MIDNDNNNAFGEMIPLEHIVREYKYVYCLLFRHVHRDRYDHRPDQAARPGLRDRHPADHPDGEDGFRIGPTPITTLVPLLHTYVQYLAGPQPEVGDGADGGAVQVRVHGRAAPHRDGASQDARGEGEGLAHVIFLHDADKPT